MAKALVEDGQSFSYAFPQMWDQNMLFPLLDLLKPYKLLLCFSFVSPQKHREIQPNRLRLLAGRGGDPILAVVPAGGHGPGPGAPAIFLAC